VTLSASEEQIRAGAKLAVFQEYDAGVVRSDCL